MQAILTKLLPATNTMPTRYEASCEVKTITVSQVDELNVEENHVNACRLLCQEIARDNDNKYGKSQFRSVWLARKSHGQLPTGDYAHVFSMSQIESDAWIK